MMLGVQLREALLMHNGARTRLARTHAIFEHTEVADEPQALMHLPIADNLRV